MTNRPEPAYLLWLRLNEDRLLGWAAVVMLVFVGVLIGYFVFPMWAVSP